MSELQQPLSEDYLWFRIRQIIQETADSKTFVLESLDGRPLRYQAGQYLTFLIEHYGHEVRRSYSLSSAPSVDDYPTITIKRVENGEISRYWMDDITEGSLVKTLFPAGRFTYTKQNETTPRDLVLIGAGSGITPLFSILKETLTTDPNAHVTLIYANRSERTTIFFDSLKHWQTLFPNRLNSILLFSQPSHDWSEFPPRLNNSRIEKLVSEVLHFNRSLASFFICGPYSLMRTTEITLLFLGFEKAQIRKENFVILPKIPIIEATEAHTATIRLKGIANTIAVPPNTTLLQAALNSGLQLPYSCKGGQCANCAGMHRAGKLHMSINDVLTETDLKQGWILTCTAYPEDDEVIVEMV